MYSQAAVNDPVLHIGLYSTGDAPSEVDDYHWVFIVGPSHEEAGSHGTLYSMEPRHHKKWCWSYSQCIVPLQDLSALLVRLIVAEVVDMNMLQMTMLRWAGEVSMRAQVEWMSVRWVQRVLKSLEEDEACLGKMKSFESVEAEGRRLAGMEEKKRNVDIAIRSLVLYAAVHPNYRPPCENDESHWAFLSGPASKTAESERADHVVEMQLDSGGWPIWGYSQTAIPLPDADDLRVRMLIADIARLGLLGEMVRDHDVTPTVDRTTFAGNSQSKTLLRIQENLEVLERQPDCFTFKFHKSSMCEEVLVEEVTSNQPGAKPWWPSRPGGKTFCLLRASKMPNHDEAEIVVNLDLSRPEPITMSVAIHLVTSVLGAAAKALRRQNAAREQREKQSEQNCEPIAEPREIAVGNSWFYEVQRRRLDQEKTIAENEAERKRAPTWFNVAAKEGGDKHGIIEDEGGEEEENEEEEEGNEEKEADDEEEEEEEEAEAEDKAEAEANDDDDDEEEDESEYGRDDEDVESGDGTEVNEMLDEEAGEKTSTSRPALVRSKTILFPHFNKPGSASEVKRLVKEERAKDKDAMESDEDEDEDDEDDEDEDGDGDGKQSSEENEDKDGDDDENKEDSSSDDEEDDEDDSSEDDDSENGHD